MLAAALALSTTAGASAILVADAALSATGPAGSHPDAALLAIGRDLDAAHAAWFAHRPEDTEAHNARAAWWDANGERIDAATSDGSDAFLAVLSEGCAPFEAVFARSQELTAVNDRLSDEVFALRPTTLEGLAVQLRALAGFEASLWDGPLEDLDWEKQMLRQVVENALSLVGLDRLGRPVKAQV